MKVQDVIRYFGGRPQTARACGVSPQAVHLWIRDGLSDERQYHIAYITGGRLEPDLSLIKKMGDWDQYPDGN